MKKVYIKGIIFILLLLGNLITFSIGLYAKFNNNSKLLIIVDEKTKLDEVYLSEKSDYIDIVYHNKMDYYDIINYSSYAVENNIIQNDLKLSLFIE